MRRLLGCRIQSPSLRTISPLARSRRRMTRLSPSPPWSRSAEDPSLTLSARGFSSSAKVVLALSNPATSKLTFLEITGNFSFAHSLLIQSPPIVTPQLLIATAFDSQATAEEKYPDLMIHVKAIRDAGAKVIFGVDATNLHKNKDITEHKGLWDRVVFNFPHVGAFDRRGTFACCSH